MVTKKKKKNIMLLENLPSELLLEIFSYLHPSDLYTSFLPLSNSRISHLISDIDLSLDLTYTSYARFLLILTYCSPSQIVFLRLTNQYSHGLLITEFFSTDYFRPEKFLRLRSLHLDDIIGNEIDCLPPYLEKLYIKFHKKAKYALKFYQLALRSTSLKQCYLIGGYAFDNTTCSHISSTTIEQLHMAIKSFPNDLLVLLQALPCLTKLKTCVYTRSSGIQFSSLFTSPLTHLNIDLQGSGVTLTLIDSQLLSHLPRLQSLIYHSYGKSNEDMNTFIQLSSKLSRFQFIRKGLSANINITNGDFNNDLVTAVQEITHNKNSRRSLILHTTPYPDKVLNLPFVQWNKVHNLSANSKHIPDEEIYDRVERVRINLSEFSINTNIPSCRHVKHLTLFSNNETNKCIISPNIISSLVCLPSVRHLIINTQTSLFNFNQLFTLMSLHSLDIAWSQLRPYFLLSNIKILSLISECVSWKEIQYLIIHLIPQLEHLQMNVTTSNECRQILNFLLSPKYKNNLISIKICICQTLSDQIKQDLEPILLSSQWIKVKWRMDNWYLYIWK
ncbi:unnamed protein product [Rotaria sordida]|uniref:F-box domain-containing protein n=3 Tax=Rotaria sordida TaxID=392033 RepID=A0A813TVN7_9BILA|nr:unnamed protein product [Rotaria sordida]CAF0889270.1 unnamed protein product [Rotaria sordida]